MEYNINQIDITEYEKDIKQLVKYAIGKNSFLYLVQDLPLDVNL